MYKFLKGPVCISPTVASPFPRADSQAVCCATMSSRRSTTSSQQRQEYGVTWIKSSSPLAPPMPGGQLHDQIEWLTCPFYNRLRPGPLYIDVPALQQTHSLHVPSTAKAVRPYMYRTVGLIPSGIHRSNVFEFGLLYLPF